MRFENFASLKPAAARVRFTRLRDLIAGQEASKNNTSDSGRVMGDFRSEQRSLKAGNNLSMKAMEESRKRKLDELPAKSDSDITGDEHD